MRLTRELEQDANALFHDVAVDYSIPDESFGIGDLRPKLLLPRLQIFRPHNAIEVRVDESLVFALERDESALLDGRELATVIELGQAPGRGVAVGDPSAVDFG